MSAQNYEDIETGKQNNFSEQCDHHITCNDNDINWWEKNYDELIRINYSFQSRLWNFGIFTKALNNFSGRNKNWLKHPKNIEKKTFWTRNGSKVWIPEGLTSGNQVPSYWLLVPMQRYATKKRMKTQLTRKYLRTESDKTHITKRTVKNKSWKPKWTEEFQNKSWKMERRKTTPDTLPLLLNCWMQNWTFDRKKTGKLQKRNMWRKKAICQEKKDKNYKKNSQELQKIRIRTWTNSTCRTDSGNTIVRERVEYIKVQIKINGKEADFVSDTGSPITVSPKSSI